MYQKHDLHLSLCFLSLCPLLYQTHSFSSSSRYLKWQRHTIFVLIIDLEKEKQAGLKLLVGIMKSRLQGLFSLPIPSVCFFSFSDWHLLIQGSWLPITCFQSHFKLAAGDPTLGLSFRRVDEAQGEREGEEREFNGKLLNSSSCLVSRFNKHFGSVASGASLKNWLQTPQQQVVDVCAICAHRPIISGMVVLLSGTECAIFVSWQGPPY